MPPSLDMSHDDLAISIQAHYLHFLAQQPILDDHQGIRLGAKVSHD